MTRRRHLGVVAGLATLLAATPLSAIFERWTWLLQCTIAIALVTGAATLARALRAPLWAQLLGMIGGLLLTLTWLFPSGQEYLVAVPSPQTFGHFSALMTQSAQDVRAYGVPVPDLDPLLFITVMGVGAVAILVDLLSVGLGRPALAGLPMLAIYSVPVAVYVDSVSPVPFVIGALGFLWLLVADNVDRVRRFGRRFTGDGRDVDVWEASPLAAAGRRLSVVGVVLAILLPVAVPGMTSGLFDTFASGTDRAGGSGRGTGNGRVNLFAALSGQLNQSEVRELVTVTTSDPQPAYLRFGVADTLQRDGFASRPPNGIPMRDVVEPRSPKGPGVSNERYEATVQVSRDFDMPMLPVFPVPTGARDLDGRWFYDRDAQIVFTDRGRNRDRSFSFDFVRTSYSPAALRRALPLAENDPMRKQFTGTPVEPVVSRLVQRLTADKRTEYDRVRAIYDYFSRDNGFSYSLRTEGGTSGRDIVDFLNTKVGFCQQYAAAMAWLVRAADIPARVAFGFTNGTVQQDGAMVMTNRNLHAWTEVYFNGFGWVPFDATPAASVPGSTRTAWAPDTDRPEPVVPSAAPGAPTGADPSAGPTGADDPARDVDDGLAIPGGPAAPSGPTWPWWTAAGVLLTLALLAVPALHRSLVRRRRAARVAAASVAPPGVAGAVADAPPGAAWVVVTGADADRARSDAHAAWDELIDTLVDYRVPVDPTETPRATADRLVGAERVRDESAEALRLLGRAEERARYARDPVQAAALPEALRTVRRAVAAGADRRTRWTAAVLPPSVMLRWRSRTLDRFASAVAALGRYRNALVRWSPRRLLANRASR
ncbi:Transglutaminase-like enzyme, putative cysteine protease [Micromonospora pattaloongensis]|uniref:Transglutaminase-like enzyme, putative cysteine protease n=1 Tax=Micromonospora pattaloongensis TaxID=405436 RepID=A0A1H3Q1L3_9ACTN|nr:transglutaminaseTgpA domain-containing protein [Micromonospora pattaloongensis]SDZ07412.1 Transglutaminase-like enzyme, putative cysteine protease [Micromonospora pattaloongensis]